MNSTNAGARTALVVGADAIVQPHVIQVLKSRGVDVVAVSSPAAAIESLAGADFEFTLIDLASCADGGASPVELLSRLKLQPGDPGPLIGLAPGGGDGAMAGARGLPLSEVVRQPFANGELEKAIDRVARRGWAEDRPAADDDPAARIRREIGLWRSPRMLEVREILREAARVDVTVLVTGETGTGKEVVARAIHALSSRRDGPFVKVNCAAMPRELLESELFGHERGAFTGAHRQTVGRFEAAHRGTIFLDEIGEFHPALQAKLLHVLQDGDFSRVGGKSTLKVDVRVVAATNQDLEKAVQEGRFREDLYYRLNVIQLVVPPLRDRVEEIPVLADYFVERYAKAYRRSEFSLPATVMSRLVRHRYPGNVRELENLIKRMIVLGDPLMVRTPFTIEEHAVARNGHTNGHTTDHGNGAGHGAANGADHPCLREISRNASLLAERNVIAQVLEQTGWNRVHAARRLRISYRGLLYKMKRVGLKGPRPTITTPTPGPSEPPEDRADAT
ncbi:MAG TPA: sigma-54 dependent transcriptional regulator [Methylomirabilota bacterium]|jgi:two-component system response regulator AtoC|nr:sigma-54 dependent transcriptional regulator [Methylomirabilota bacterium]